MANIIKLMNLLSDDEIRIQLALFEGVNMSGVAKEAGNRLLSGLADVANAFSETFTNKQVINFEYNTVSDTVMDKYIDFAKDNRDELVDMCNKRFAMIYKEVKGSEYEGDIDSPIFTKELVDIAAYGFNINQNKPVGIKIDEICSSYEKVLLTALYNKMTGLAGKELSEYGKLIDMSLAKLSLDNKKALQEMLLPASFNGKGIILALRKRKDLLKLKASINLLGEDAFKMIDADVSVANSAIRSLGRVSRILLARLIYVLGKKCGRSFGYGEERLPSGGDIARVNEYKAQDKSFREELATQITIQKKIDGLEKNKESLINQITRLDGEIENVMKGFYEARNEFDELESIKNEYLDKKHSTSESKVYYNKVNETKRNMDRISDNAERKSNRLCDLKSKLEEIEGSIKLENINLNKAKEKNAKEVTKRADELMNSWNKRFNKITFAPEIFENIIVRFTLEQRLEIEKMLLEIDNEDDYYDLNKNYCEIKTYIGGRDVAVVKLDDWLCEDII